MPGICLRREGPRRCDRLTDAGNVESTLPPCHRPVVPNTGSSLSGSTDTDRIERADGSISSIFAASNSRAPRRQSHLRNPEAKTRWHRTVMTMAAGIARVRNPHTPTAASALCAQPEGWLDRRCVRIRRRSTPLSAVCPFTARSRYSTPRARCRRSAGHRSYRPPGHNRTQSDSRSTASVSSARLLAARAKASARGRFRTAGLLRRSRGQPGTAADIAGRPALEFHSTTETLVRAFSPEIDITSIGWLPTGALGYASCFATGEVTRK